MSLKRHLVVDLDALLDTRLTTLEEFLTEDELVDLLSSGQYHLRLHDAYPKAPKQTFAAAYARRGVKQLKHAVLTNVLFLLRKLVLEFFQEKINEPFRENPEVLVNFYPYDIPVDFKVDFCETLKARLTQDTDGETSELMGSLTVNWVQLEPEVLTPQYCQQHQYSLLIKYDGLQWFSAHLGSLVERPLKDLILIAPALYLEGDPNDPALQDYTRDGINPLMALRDMANHVMTLNLIDARHFSVIGFREAGGTDPEASPTGSTTA